MVTPIMQLEKRGTPTGEAVIKRRRDSTAPGVDDRACCYSRTSAKGPHSGHWSGGTKTACDRGSRGYYHRDYSNSRGFALGLQAVEQQQDRQAESELTSCRKRIEGKRVHNRI